VANVGDRLKEERTLKGWSQRDLAEESGTNVDTISGIERGQHEPRPSTLRKLAAALGVQVRDLFEDPVLPGKAEAPPTGPPDLDVEDLKTPEEVAAVVRQLQPMAKEAIEFGNAVGWLEDRERRDKIFSLLRDLGQRWQDLGGPLATITEREGSPTEINYLRDPTPEERSRLRAEYPNAKEVESITTVVY
jgi:transcriptional regulator with XRE-family HTH domain